MGEDRKDNEAALAAAGYTGARAAILFCAVLATVGALVGSVIFAIIWNVLVPGTPETVSTAVGAAAGALFGGAIGAIKIRQGNIEAREQVEDLEWRRLILRQRYDKTP